MHISCHHLLNATHIIHRRAKELASKQAAKKEGEGGFDKFQYLIGQTEVFAHFLAGEYGGTGSFVVI